MQELDRLEAMIGGTDIETGLGYREARRLIASIRAEVERLRAENAALREIAQWVATAPETLNTDVIGIVSRARALLGETHEPEQKASIPANPDHWDPRMGTISDHVSGIIEKLETPEEEE